MPLELRASLKVVTIFGLFYGAGLVGVGVWRGGAVHSQSGTIKARLHVGNHLHVDLVYFRHLLMPLSLISSNAKIYH